MPFAVRHLFLPVVLAVLVHVSLGSAEEPIDPDRPDIATSPGTVAPASVQVESGLADEHTRLAGGDQRRLFVETGVRVGMTERIELRLGGEPFVRLRGRERDTDHGDLTVGFKYRFLDGAGGRPALAVLPSLKVPLAREPLGTERPDVSVLGIAAFRLPGDLTLTVNGALAALGQRHPEGELLQGFGAVNLTRDLVAERVQAVAEVFANSPEERNGSDVVAAGLGVIYRLTPWLAVDAAIHTTVHGQGPEYTLRAGLSVRLPR
jgi:outer membrane putative beta-barrel porin/alpha-amylase